MSGTPVIVTWPFVVVAGLFGYLYFQLLSHGRLRFQPTGTIVGATIALVVALFLSVLIHELGHGLAGRIYHLKPHEYVITFFGGHTTFEGGALKPGSRAVISLLGPVANLVLAGLCTLIVAPTLPGFMGTPDTPMQACLVYVAMTNGLIGLFNLIPAAPLDGGGVVEAIVWKISGRRALGEMTAAVCGLVAAAGILFWALLPERGASLDQAMWRVMIALIVGQGAYLALRRALTLKRYEAFSVRQSLIPAIALPHHFTASQGQAALDQATPDTWVVVIDSSGQPEGVIGPSAWRAVPPDQAGTLTLDSVMQVVPRGWGVPASAGGVEALWSLAGPARQTHYLPVVEDSRVVGVLDMQQVRRLVGLPAEPSHDTRGA